MATNNSSEFDISGVVFKPINLQNKRPRLSRTYYKNAKVSPAISSDEESNIPNAQVPMYERWIDDCKVVKVIPSINKVVNPKAQVPSFEQVPMYERWNW